jgi:hypothetical protein
MLHSNDFGRFHTSKTQCKSALRNSACKLTSNFVEENAKDINSTQWLEMTQASAIKLLLPLFMFIDVSVFPRMEDKAKVG